MSYYLKQEHGICIHMCRYTVLLQDAECKNLLTSAKYFADVNKFGGARSFSMPVIYFIDYFCLFDISRSLLTPVIYFADVFLPFLVVHGAFQRL